jgi:isopentenyl-diphosphate delta-isomerase
MIPDQVTLVTEDDVVIGALDKYEAHRVPAQLHRAISVFLFRTTPQGPELLIQQRSSTKIVGALQWANSACGNVWPEETYEQCAARRLEKELGIACTQLQDIYTLRYAVPCNEQYAENEIDHVFVGWYNGLVSPHPEEVATVEWMPWDSVIQLHTVTTRPLTPWFSIMLQEDTLISQLTSVVRARK